MQHEVGHLITDFQAVVALAVWVGAVLVHGVYRSLGDARPDRIRSSGPLD